MEAGTRKRKKEEKIVIDPSKVDTDRKEDTPAELPNVRKCRICKYTTTNPSHFVSHQNIHAIESLGIRVYRCKAENCHFIAESRNGLSIHRKVSGHTGQLHQCPECSYTSVNMSNITVHLDTVHVKRHRYSCPYCQDKFYRGAKLRLHIQNFHEDERKFKVYTCNTCRYTCHSNRDICHHVSAHKHTGRKFKCSQPGCFFLTHRFDIFSSHLFQTNHPNPDTTSHHHVNGADPSKQFRNERGNKLRKTAQPQTIPVIRVVQSKPSEQRPSPIVDKIKEEEDDDGDEVKVVREVKAPGAYKRCIYCSATTAFGTASALQQHLRKVHGMEDVTSEATLNLPRSYSCKYCKKPRPRFTSLKSLRDHTVRFHPAAYTNRRKLCHRPRIKRHSKDSEIRSNDPELEKEEAQPAQNIFDILKTKDIRISSGCADAEGHGTPSSRIDLTDPELEPSKHKVENEVVVVEPIAEVVEIPSEPPPTPADSNTKSSEVLIELPLLDTPTTDDTIPQVTLISPPSDEATAATSGVTPQQKLSELYEPLVNIPNISLSELEHIHRVYMYHAQCVNFYYKQYQEKYYNECVKTLQSMVSRSNSSSSPPLQAHRLVISGAGTSGVAPGLPNITPPTNLPLPNIAGKGHGHQLVFKSPKASRGSPPTQVRSSPVFECPVEGCSARFQTLKEQDQHSMSQHATPSLPTTPGHSPQTPSSPQNFNCGFCSVNCTSFEDYVKHFKEYHIPALGIGNNADSSRDKTNPDESVDDGNP